MNLMTRDDYPASETAILHAYGETITPPRTGKPGRPRAPHKAAPAGLNSAGVTKRREKGRGVEVGTRGVFGTMAAVVMALSLSKRGNAWISRTPNRSFPRLWSFRQVFADLSTKGPRRDRSGS